MKFFTITAVCASLSCAAAIPGCNYITPAAYIIQGPPSIEAEFTLPNKPTVVFVDDRRSVVNPASLRAAIGDQVAQDLMIKELVSRTISTQDAIVLVRQRERSDQLMSVEEIGKAVGAEQVVFVEMLAFRDTPDGVTPRPEATCRVRVTDVTNGARLYPPPDANDTYRVVQVRIREVDPALYESRASRLKVAQSLAAETGREVAKLFYKHEVKELGGNLNPR